MLTKQEILDSIQKKMAAEKDRYEVLCRKEDFIDIFDEGIGKETIYRYPETITAKMVCDTIFISPNIDKRFKPNREKLADTLYKMLEKDCFMTLKQFILIDNNEDELWMLSDKFDNEYFQECIDLDKELGKCLFFDDTIIINVGLIHKLLEEKMKETNPEDIMFAFLTEFWLTIIHEFRHLLMDSAALALPEGKYHLIQEEGESEDSLDDSEEKVEEYCQEYFNAFLGWDTLEIF